MKGWRTIIANGVALVASLLVGAGVDVPLETQGHITTGILAIVNIALRFKTDTAVGEKQ